MARHVKRYGATPGCAGCRAAAANKKPINHKERCRQRFLRLFREANDPRVELLRTDLSIADLLRTY